MNSPATAVAALWGSVLPGPVGPHAGAGDDFEARVWRAWEHLKGGYFTIEEHDRLRVALRKLLASDAESDA